MAFTRSVTRPDGNRRSEVLRRAAAAYLRRSRSRRVAEAYAQAYGRDAGLGDDWTGWEAEGAWPAK